MLRDWQREGMVPAHRRRRDRLLLLLGGPSVSRGRLAWFRAGGRCERAQGMSRQERLALWLVC